MSKKIYLTKGVNLILTGFLGFLGYAGCNLFTSCSYGIPYAEYGCPSADYTVKGAVVNNKECKTPIPGIRVGYSPQEWNEEVFGPQPEHYWAESNAYVITNTNGEFKLTGSFFDDGPHRKINVFVEDIDGETNGLFQSKMFEVDFKDSTHSGRPGNWYGGEFTITTTIQLAEIIPDE